MYKLCIVAKLLKLQEKHIYRIKFINNSISIYRLVEENIYLFLEVLLTFKLDGKYILQGYEATSLGKRFPKCWRKYETPKRRDTLT